MNERLITRFSCGLIAELQKPNVKLCVDILENKIRHEGLSIPEDVVEFIASTANGSVRDLQGVVNSLMAYSVVYNCSIDMKLAERVIKHSVKVENNPLTVEDIIESVCQHYNVTPANINSRSRKKDYVMARQVSIYLAQIHQDAGKPHRTTRGWTRPLYGYIQLQPGGAASEGRSQVLKRDIKHRKFI